MYFVIRKFIVLTLRQETLMFILIVSNHFTQPRIRNFDDFGDSRSVHFFFDSKIDFIHEVFFLSCFFSVIFRIVYPACSSFIVNSYSFLRGMLIRRSEKRWRFIIDTRTYRIFITSLRGEFACRTTFVFVTEKPVINSSFIKWNSLNFSICTLVKYFFDRVYFYLRNFAQHYLFNIIHKLLFHINLKIGSLNKNLFHLFSNRSPLSLHSFPLSLCASPVYSNYFNLNTSI